MARIEDESFIRESERYLDQYTDRLKSLKDKENEHVLRCNKLAFLEQRLSIIRKVSRNHKHQEPESGTCPICSQTLPINVEAIYKYRQEEHDTTFEIDDYKEQIKETQARINSLKRSISTERASIVEQFGTLKSYTDGQMSMDHWLNNKANAKLLDNLDQRHRSLEIEISDVSDELGRYKTEEQVAQQRASKELSFKAIFTTYLSALGVQLPQDNRYTRLYEISAFPSLGVELHKTVIAYHFAFNYLVKSTPGIHRFPFMLDAIFKEDIDVDNRELIMKFISQEKPKDTQIIFSLADTKADNKVQEYNDRYFANSANLILIGNGENERAFLYDYDDQSTPDLITATQDLLDGALGLP